MRKKIRSIHWMSWERLCKPKSEGGIGFRHIHDFNIALLGKQGWRLLTKSESLVARVYRARYYPNSNFLSATIGGSPSFVWKSVLEAQSIIKEGVACRVGSGTTINVLKDPWLPDMYNPYVTSMNVALEGITISSLFVTDEDRWDADILNDLFEDREVNLILSIPINRSDSDVWYWRKERLGNYSVKTAYTMIQMKKSGHNTDNFSVCWKRLWALKIPSKVKHFMWRAITGCLPAKTQLQQKHVNVDVVCPMCNHAPESIAHILLNCSFARECWSLVTGSLNSEHFNSFDI